MPQAEHLIHLIPATTVLKGVGLDNMIEVGAGSTANMPAAPDAKFERTGYQLDPEYRSLVRVYGLAMLIPVLVARSDSSHAVPGKQAIARAVAAYVNERRGSITSDNAAEMLGPKLDLVALAVCLVRELSTKARAAQHAELLSTAPPAEATAIRKLSDEAALARHVMLPELLKGWGALFMSWTYNTGDADKPFCRRLLKMTTAAEATAIIATNFPGDCLKVIEASTEPQGELQGVLDGPAAVAAEYRDTGSTGGDPGAGADGGVATTVGEPERTGLILAMQAEINDPGSLSHDHIERFCTRDTRAADAGAPDFGPRLAAVNEASSMAVTGKAPECADPRPDRSGRRMKGVKASVARFMRMLAVTFALTWQRTLDSLAQEDELDLDVHGVDGDGQYECTSRRSATGMCLDQTAQVLSNNPAETADWLQCYNWTVGSDVCNLTTKEGMSKPSDAFRRSNVDGVLADARLLGDILRGTEILVIEGLTVECPAALKHFHKTADLTRVVNEWFHQCCGLPLECPDGTTWMLGSFTSQPKTLVLVSFGSSTASLRCMPSWGKMTNLLARITQYKRACLAHVLLADEAVLRDHPMSSFEASSWYRMSDLPELKEGMMTAIAAFHSGLRLYRNKATRHLLPPLARKKFENSVAASIDAVNDPDVTPTAAQQLVYDNSLRGGNENSVAKSIAAVNDPERTPTAAQQRVYGNSLQSRKADNDRQLREDNAAADKDGNDRAAELNTARSRIMLAWPGDTERVEYTCAGEPSRSTGLYLANRTSPLAWAPLAVMLNLSDLTDQNHLGPFGPTAELVAGAAAAAAASTTEHRRGQGSVNGKRRKQRSSGSRQKRANVDAVVDLNAE